jgi:hypothetical protein
MGTELQPEKWRRFDNSALRALLPVITDQTYSWQVRLVAWTIVPILPDVFHQEQATNRKEAEELVGEDNWGENENA